MDEDNSEAAAAEKPDSGSAITRLAELPKRALVDEQFVANVFDVTPRTVRRMVARCEIPPPLSVGGRSMWLAGRILDFLDGRAQQAQRDAEREAERISEYS